ncbi:LysE/ArgO family amino acid transporter [Nioella aestuarii]|uniref:LysE/ArgO family amino acid transporter n=1 Tax=Nioella aestuarii TaxID=1662864 RepID=UPI003D7F42E2
MFQAASAGFYLGFSLILAIGAQNAFVLRQGLRRAHVLPVVLTCALSDALLIALGVGGFSAITDWMPWVAPVLRFGGAAFLIWYGARSFIAMWRGGEALRAADAEVEAGSLRAALLTCLALTWLNPHVYLDTVLLIGSIATQYGDTARWFGIGAVTSSFVFFFSLGFGARLLAPVFARPRAWQVLDGVIGMVMWAIAAKLLAGA